MMTIVRLILVFLMVTRGQNGTIGPSLVVHQFGGDHTLAQLGIICSDTANRTFARSVPSLPKRV